MVRDSRAVSPVVGVMLMLVVTIVLAAVVSSYAGGLAGTQ
ncbi:type IV pilin, partial [Archaeoglobales archaeon]